MEKDPHFDRPGSFWDERYRTGKTPWDFGGLPEDLALFLERNPRLGHVLVPGCGSAYEVKALLEVGNEVLGIDLSEEAIRRALDLLGEEHRQVLCQGDFFEMALPEGHFDAIYERTFLCALPPDYRSAYSTRAHKLLKPGGLLFGYFLYGEEPEPPPSPMDPAEEQTAFQEFFDLVVTRPSKDPLPIFEGMERWQVWRRRE